MTSEYDIRNARPRCEGGKFFGSLKVYENALDSPGCNRISTNNIDGGVESIGIVFEVARSRISARELGCVTPKRDPKPNVPNEPVQDAERRASTPMTPPPDLPPITPFILTSSNSVALIRASSIMKFPCICAYPIINVSARGVVSVDGRLSGDRGNLRV